jgi:hypothetical protein
LVLIAATGCIYALRLIRSKQISDELERLPIGIEVVHHPSTALAIKTGELTGWRHIWHFQTTVRLTIDRPLQIEKYGMGVWHRGRWFYSPDRSPIAIGPYISPNCTVFSAEDFVQEFHCPGGWLDPGVEYCDANNWAGSGGLRTFQQKWFFIARDDEGCRYKGEAIINLDGRLDWR